MLLILIEQFHRGSISRIPAGPETARARRACAYICLAASVLLCPTGTASAAPDSACSTSVAALPAIEDRRLPTRGTGSAQLSVSGLPGHQYLVEVEERGNDALVEVFDSAGHPGTRADHPERRTGTRRVIVAPVDPQPFAIRVTGKEHAGVSGTARIHVRDLAGLAGRPDCLGIVQLLARADADYADGQQIARGLEGPAQGSARHYFLRAAEGFLAAQRGLVASGDRGLRGQTALALAAVEYLDLQNWRRAVEWSEAAKELLQRDDPYRHARADALAAAALIEIATEAAPGQPIPGFDADSKALYARARRTLGELRQFHLRRHERYDAALQLNNTGLSFLYEGRFPEGAAVLLSASNEFGAVGERPRQALAWQNRALCFWGLGHLPQALRSFNRALKDLGPGVYPQLYLLTLNNTALANYALGNFDESLRLHDRALAFAVKIQSRREEAQSLYGIGVTYYALGDPDRAQPFLERALAIRSVALDGRGRLITLRALATIYGERQLVKQALAADEEALRLATAPYSIARIRIQLAIHTAAAGRRDEAIRMLDDAIATTGRTDQLVRAEALLQRAGLRRDGGAAVDALRDLAESRPLLHQYGSVTEEFAADLETARNLRQLGHTDEALVAVDRALARSDAIRLQTATPELRAQLQTPLRPAHDLRLDLLWQQFDQDARAGRSTAAAHTAALAFVSADASRAHSFADVSAQRYSPTVRSELGPELARREVLYREIAARRFALAAREDLSGADDPRAVRLRDEIAGLQRAADTVDSAIAARAAPRSPANGVTDAAGVAMFDRLPAGTALVSYWLGTESAYAWVVSAHGVQWLRLGKTGEITDRARAFHDALTRFVDLPVEERRRTGAALYDAVIRPLEPWLALYRQWIVIPDGALNYVPLAALRGHDASGDFYVVARHDIALTPAAWMLRAADRAGRVRPARRLLLVSDPVYDADDPRLAGRPRPEPADSHYQRIPWTAHEAEAIAAQFPGAQIDRLTGLDATRERLLALDWSRYRFIHIASHGSVDARMPQLSALVLGAYDREGRTVDGAVRVADFSLLRLDADVAVFSGCDTALGKQVLSEGLVGIGYTTLARGARTVVASLWRVPDEITAQLMTEFYRYLLRDSMSAPAALGAAMRSVVVHDPSADPALWAPFQVSVVTLGRSQEPLPARTAHVSTSTDHGGMQ